MLAPSASPASQSRDESILGDAEFEWIRHYVRNRAGIRLKEEKRDMVRNRLIRAMRACGVGSTAEYFEMLRGGDERCRRELLHALTTNVTQFLREQHHFEALEQEVLPQILDQNTEGRRVRIWSAGCSSGEEPYSIAMTVAETMGQDLDRWDLLILASDLDATMVRAGERAEYPEEALDPLPLRWRTKYFEPLAARRCRVKQGLRALVRFRTLNLMDEWPMKRSFDAVFCRNVVIYFDVITQRRLFDRMAERMRPGGWLFVGHSESLHNISDRFEFMGRSMYRRIR